VFSGHSWSPLSGHDPSERAVSSAVRVQFQVLSILTLKDYDYQAAFFLCRSGGAKTLDAQTLESNNAGISEVWLRFSNWQFLMACCLHVGRSSLELFFEAAISSRSHMLTHFKGTWIASASLLILSVILVTDI
jgi:hypothetical protein